MHHDRIVGTHALEHLEWPPTLDHEVFRDDFEPPHWSGVIRRGLLENPRVMRRSQSNTESEPREVRSIHRDRLAAYIALVGAFSGLPPLSVHIFAEVAITQPLPLHEFCPMQPLLADLHELWPLQLLPPMHFTLSALAEFPELVCARTGVLKNIAPTAAAKTAPVIVLRSIVVTSPYKWDAGPINLP